jgi:hypothetical protein
LLIGLEFRGEPTMKVKNVGKREGISRSIIGVILIILAFLMSGAPRWVLGFAGVVVILTAMFGY